MKRSPKNSSQAPETDSESQPAGRGLGEGMRKVFLSIAHRLPGSFFTLQRPLVGEVLVREQVIAPHQLEKALARQEKHSRKLGQMVVKMGFAEESEVLDAINGQYRIEAKSLEENIQVMIDSRDSFRKSLTRVRNLMRFKLSLALVCVIWLTIFSISLVMLGRHREQLRDQALQMGVASLNMTAENAKDALDESDDLSLERQIKVATASEGMVYGIISDTKGTVLAHSNPEKIGSHITEPPQDVPEQREGNVNYFVYRKPGGSEVLHLSKALKRGNQILGKIQLGVSLDFINEQLQEEGILIVVLSLLIVAFGIILAFNLGGNFLRPLTSLLASTHDEEDKEIREIRVKARRDHKLEELATSLDAISRKLGEKVMMEKSFGRYVNPRVVDMIKSNPEEPWQKGTRSEATILFTDVRGFTAMFESEEPETIVEALNEYFEIASKAIHSQGGYVDKFIGDAVLGVFGVPDSLEDHSIRAVKAGTSMQKEFKRRSRNHSNPLLEKIGIGINTGLVVSGNIGSEEKIEYTVIGDSVNLASRINEFARAGEVIISESVVAQIPWSLITLTELPPQLVKGKKEPLVAYKVLKTVF